ncbi:MAG: RNA polymerase sigma factor [Lewinellaceae bacterium]|nr:RNA polymerase sigma factor [Lewinellaceae bacterium]
MGVDDTDNIRLDFILEGCRQGKRAAQRELYDTYFSYGLSICLRYARSREEALELLNDAYYKVLRHIDQYNADFPFQGWFRRILINTAIDHHRKKEKFRSEELSDQMQPATVENEGLNWLNYQDLLELTQQLSPAYRLVFNLYVMEGLSHEEIAQRLQISVGASKSNLAKARQKLQSKIKARENKRSG